MDGLDPISPFFPLPEGLVIASVSETETQLIVHVASRSPTACCPLCQMPSDRIHGRYGRTVADLPCAGRRVILALTVRKFVCRTPTCPRQIFTERFPDLVQSYARITNRLREALLALGLATSAEVSERVAPALDILVSAPTLLRYLRAVSCPPPTTVRILGVDDWGATRKVACVAVRTQKGGSYLGFCPRYPARLNQVRLGQCSRVRQDGNRTVRRGYDC